METTPTPPAGAAISGPGGLLAALPGLLGYFPRDELVLVGLERGPGGAALGPVASLPLREHAGQLAAAAAIAGSVGAPPVGLALGPGNAGAAARLLVDGWRAADPAKCRPRPEPVWHVAELAVGERYRLAVLGGRAAPREAGPAGEGLIPSVAASPAMAAHLAAGELPELSREELFAPYRPARAGGATDETPGRLEERAAALAARARATPGGAGALAGRLRRGLRRAASSAGEKKPYGDGLVALAAAACLDDRLRDAACRAAAERPAGAWPVFAAAARGLGGRARANALCLAAVAAAAAGREYRAIPALAQAAAERPGHGLTRALRACAARGRLAEAARSLGEPGPGPGSVPTTRA